MLSHQAHMQDRVLTQCILDCLDCRQVCLETVLYCLNTGGKHAESAQLRLLYDCIDICQTSADFMLFGSELYAQICASSADICERCAQGCDEWADDPRMQACAEICRRCADSCRHMGMQQAA